MAWIILGVCLVLFLVGALTGPNARMFYAKTGMESRLKKIGGRMIVNTKIDDKIDYIYVSKYGVVLIKMIFTPGEYFGGDKQANWTLINRGKKNTIKNPIKPVEEAKDLLKNEYGIDSKCCVIFKSGFTKGVNSKVIIKSNEIEEFIGNTVIYSDEQIKEINNKLSNLKK